MDLSKSAHGMEWGWHQRYADNWRIGLRSHGGCLERIQDQSDITGEMLVKFGNNFNSGWIHPDNIPHRNWYFWDNPELPQLLNPNPANPAGNKDFVRFTRGSLFTETFNSESNSARLDRVLRDLSSGQTSLEELIRPVPVRVQNTRRVLLCPSSPNCFRYYYKDTITSWLSRWSHWASQNGYEPVVRRKPARPERVKNPRSRLYEHLLLEDYAFTISQHSVAAVESILAGVPAVTTGPHPIGPLYTPPEWAATGDFVTPESDLVWNWIGRLAYNTYHKSELFTGAWHQ